MSKDQTPAERLIIARVSAGYGDAKDFWFRHGLKQSTYAHHESGTRGIRPKTAELYARLLGNCSASWILYGEGEGPKKVISEIERVAIPREWEDLSKEEPEYEDTAAYLLIYDRVMETILKLREQYPADFDHLWHFLIYEKNARGVANLSFRLWHGAASEKSGGTITERALREVAEFRKDVARMLDMFLKNRPPQKPPAD